MPKLVTFVYPIIRTDFILKSLNTLVDTMERGTYRIVIMDQSIEGLKLDTMDHATDDFLLYLRMKNVGFARAANEGIIHALKWKTPYIVVANDDTEFMYEGWFTDALEEFKSDPHILAVCPESPRIAGWGYGLPADKCIEILPHKDEYTKEDIAYLKKGDYDEAEIRARHKSEFEVPATFPFTKRGVIDGIAMWLPIFKRETFIELGLFEERFKWGGGEDYDMLARAYSCGYPVARNVCDPRFHRRMVSTMKSWVWHWWGRSKDVKVELNPALFADGEAWNNNDELWGPKFDVWGHYTDEQGVKRPITRKLPLQVG